jgi:hypothetical protein
VFLKTLKHTLEGLTGENGPVTSLHWKNYQETPDGCGQVATGIALFEFNNERGQGNSSLFFVGQ